MLKNIAVATRNYTEFKYVTEFFPVMIRVDKIVDNFDKAKS